MKYNVLTFINLSDLINNFFYHCNINVKYSSTLWMINFCRGTWPTIFSRFLFSITIFSSIRLTKTLLKKY